MDPVSAGASAVTFLTLAYSVSKTVHDMLSAIKDGPHILTRLIQDIAQLQTILQRLQQISFGPTSPTDTAELARLAQKCADDLVGFNAKLQRLNVSGAESRSGRLWRKFKSCFTEKDLEQIRGQIQTHVLMLTVRLNLLQTEQLSFSETQTTEILGLLRQLKQDVAALQPSSSSPAVAENPTSSDSMEIDEEVVRTTPRIDSALEASIARLMRLLERKACVVESDDAEELIEDIESLLNSIQRDAVVPPEAPTLRRADDNVSKELKLFKNLVLSAPSMKLNQNGPLGFLAAMPEGTVIHQQRKQKIIDIGEGVVTLTTSKRRCSFRSQSQNDAEDGDGSKREFVANLVFRPRNAGAMLTVSVNQGQVFFDSFTSMLPRVTASNILPKGSLVFQLAEAGRIQDLKKLVAEGKASVHDHDTDGWSLLHYAVDHPLMCKFLVEQGLDVNEITQSGAQKTTPLVQVFEKRAPDTIGVLLAAGADPTVFLNGSVSVLRLVGHGTDSFADHMLREIFHTSPFMLYADSETRDRQALLASACNPPVSPREPEGFDPELQIQKLAFMLDRGYDMNDVGVDGRNVLHQFFRTFSIDGAVDDWGWRQVLIYLIRRGADIRATNWKNQSVSHFAYCENICTPCSSSHSSLPGDFWDTILDTCGYDILEFRKSCPRIARYTQNYTRQDFELLWQGREDRCPYWNDNPWPDSPICDRGDWVIVHRSGLLCRKCYQCYREGIEDIFGDGFCGKCGYCLYVVDCSCHEDGYDYHKSGCPVPQRFFLDESGRWLYCPKEELDGQKYSDKDSGDEEDASDASDASNASSASASDQDHHELSPDTSDERDYLALDQGTETGVEFEAISTSGLQHQGELFKNPWEQP